MARHPSEGDGIGTILGILIAETINGIAAHRQKVAEARARRKSVSDARRAERESGERLQRWHEFTQQQKARGKAGDATQESAREALRGNGGRRSPLDDRWF